MSRLVIITTTVFFVACGEGERTTRRSAGGSYGLDRGCGQSSLTEDTLISSAEANLLLSAVRAAAPATFDVLPGTIARTRTGLRLELSYTRGDLPVCLTQGLAYTTAKGPVVHHPAFPRLDQWLALAPVPARALTETSARTACLVGEAAGEVGPATYQGRNVVVFYFAGVARILEDAQAALVGEADVYPTNPLDGKTARHSLRGLDAAGTLTTSRFVTETLGFERATRPDGRFVFPTKDDRFREVSAFTYGDRMLRWLEARSALLDADCRAIRLQVVGARYEGDERLRNNASYAPARNGNAAIITIGFGDGTPLANLAHDFDAVAHEVGHHLIAQRLPSFSGDALTLHEGLADYLVFASTGDACLARSVCAEEMAPCSAKHACLRTGDNDLSFSDPTLAPQAHLRGQVVSGLLWDLATRGGLGLDQTTDLLLAALDRIVPRPTLGDFAEALATADEELFSGRAACTLRARLGARGFPTSHLPAASCGGSNN